MGRIYPHRSRYGLRHWLQCASHGGEKQIVSTIADEG